MNEKNHIKLQGIIYFIYSIIFIIGIVNYKFILNNKIIWFPSVLSIIILSTYFSDGRIKPSNELYPVNKL